MFSMFKRKKGDNEAIYDHIISSARNPILFTDYGVPDTPHGRFQMIALHTAPIFMANAASGKTNDNQIIFDLIFNDIELSFREIGVGDLSVPKKMKRYMQDFNGIIQGHATAANVDHVDITRRNVFGEDGAISQQFQTYIKGLFN